MSRIFIITEVFYPDETTTAHILTQIASKLSSKHEVTVICGPIGYDRDVKVESNIEINNIRILRISIQNRNKNNLLQRSIKFFTLSKLLVRRLTEEFQDGDSVLMVTNPAPLVVLLSRLKLKRNFKLFLLVHDIFPENTIPAGIFKTHHNLCYKILKRIFDKAYSRVDEFIAIGRDMATVISTKVKNSEPKISIVENWADEGIKVHEGPSADTESITIGYAGNIGRVQGIENVIEVFKSSSNKKIIFEIWGSGANLPQILENIKSDKRISYKGKFSKKEQFDVLRRFDLALISLSTGMYGLGVPSKSYNILQAGRPILFIGDIKSEIALMTSEHNLGYCFDPNSAKNLKEFFDGLNSKERLIEMGYNSKKLASIYSKENQLNKFLQIFK